MKKKIISLVLAATMAIPLAFPTTASGAPEANGLKCPPSTGSSLSVNKSVSYDGNGKYKVNLEAYDPGKATDVAVPSNLILVLDESNSMTTDLYGNHFEKDCSASFLENSDWRSKDFWSDIYFCPEGSQEYIQISVNDQLILRGFNSYFKYTYTFNYNGEKSFTSDYTGTKLNLMDEIKTRFNLRGEIVVGNPYQSKEKVLKDKTKQLLEELRTAAKNKKVPCNVALVAFSNTDESCIFTGYGERRMLNNLSFGDGDHTYKNCFIDITDDNKYNIALDCVYSLKPHGNSDAFAGITLAEKILDLTKPAYNGGQSTGNKSVIFMSDGGPSIDGEAFSEDYASNAIKFTQHWENCTVGGREFSHPEFLDTKTFSLGIFGSGYSTVLPRYQDCNNLTNCQNRFLNLLSSNYPNAMDFTTTSPDTTEKTSGYYYNSEANFNDLVTAIKGRALATKTVESAATSLDDSSSAKDYVSQYFKLPAGFKTSDVTVKTVNCTGKDSNGNPTFAKSSEKFDGAHVSFDTNNNTVSVSGFSFKDNYCSESARGCGFYGKKLVISFEITPKDEFLGGNSVPTNDYLLENSSVVKDNKSGVYSGNDLKKAFNIPKADVQIKSQNLNNLINVYAGNVDPAFSDAFTLPTAGQNSWVDDYVNTSTSTVVTGGATVGNDKTIATVLTLTSKNNVPCNIGPKVLPGKLTYTMNVNVFKPTIPCADKTIYLGEEIKSFIPDNITNVKDNIEWYHDKTEASKSIMFGAEPDLSYTFDKNAPAYFEATTPVNVTSVKNGNTDIFAAATFTNNASQTGGSEFTIHVNTCKLTVTKSFIDNSQYNDSNETFVFNIKGDNSNPLSKKVNINVVVSKDNLSKVISGLPIGTYTITEDSAWSWRYTAVENSVTLSRNNSNPKVTVSNSLENTSWLNGFAKASNIFTGEAAK